MNTDAMSKPSWSERCLGVASHSVLYILVSVLLGMLGFGASDRVAAALVIAVLGVTSVALAVGVFRSVFVRAHATEAAAFHVTLVGCLFATTRLGIRLPNWVTAYDGLPEPGTLYLPIELLLYLAVTLGAAFRAKDGDACWYPSILRLLSYQKRCSLSLES